MTQVYTPPDYSHPPFGYDDYDPDPPAKIKFAVEDNTLKLNPHIAQEAKRYLKNLKAQRLPAHTVARLYHDKYCIYDPLPVPDCFRTDRRYKKAQANLEASMGRLLGLVDAATRYNLHAHHLGLPDATEAPEKIFSRENIEVWKEAIALHIPAPYYWKLQVGSQRRIHAHIIASAPRGKLARIKSEKVIKRLDNAEGFVIYVMRPSLPYSVANHAVRIQAEYDKTGKQLPRTSGFIGVGNIRTWGNHA